MGGEDGGESDAKRPCLEDNKFAVDIDVFRRPLNCNGGGGNLHFSGNRDGGRAAAGIGEEEPKGMAAIGLRNNCKEMTEGICSNVCFRSERGDDDGVSIDCTSGGKE